MAGIPYNPYIVGNPIKTREMFFGREDDFGYVEKKIGSAKSNQVLVFCGERRSGKTSILFQILGGRLGERFLPVLVDMQILSSQMSDLATELEESPSDLIFKSRTPLKGPGE